MKIKVTQADIYKGVPNNPSLCPIARAVRRKGHKTVAVGDDGYDLRIGRMGHGGVKMRLPNVAIRFVQRFDGGRSTNPFSFRITI